MLWHFVIEMYTFEKKIFCDIFENTSIARHTHTHTKTSIHNTSFTRWKRVDVFCIFAILHKSTPTWATIHEKTTQLQRMAVIQQKQGVPCFRKHLHKNFEHIMFDPGKLSHCLQCIICMDKHGSVWPYITKNKAPLFLKKQKKHTYKKFLHKILIRANATF